MKYALSRVDGRSIYILSAKHGLLTPDTIIRPYDLHMKDDGAVDAETVREQAEDMGIISEQAIVLGGQDYRECTQLAWPDAEYPLKGRGGMGSQMSWMKEQITK